VAGGGGVTAREVLDGIKGRHNAWYNGDDSEATWSDDLDFVESYELGESTSRERAMAHEIVREDIPRLTAAVEGGLEALDDLMQNYDANVRYADLEGVRAAIDNALKESQ
jgi:hypothetical protein